jgi:hypothetical protein
MNPTKIQLHLFESIGILRSMNSNHPPVILNKYSIEPIGQKILITNLNSGKIIVTDKLHEPFLSLVDNQRSLKDLLLEYHLLGYQIKLKSLTQLSVI